jgi:hypothetical protein
MRKFLTSFFKRFTENIRDKEPRTTSSEEKKTIEKRQFKATRTSKKRKQKEEKDTDSINPFQELLSSLSPQKRKLISIAGEIRLDPYKTQAAFMARQLVQATLPHKNPGNIQAWSRKNGDLTLTIRPGWDERKEKSVGYPYGVLPRLLLFWITTEAIRTKSPRIELGNSLAKFMEELELDPYQGGKRSDVKRLRDQMRRLFQSTISFTQYTKGESWLNMQVAPKGMLWWDDEQTQQDTLGKNWIQLGEDFFKAITSSPVPIDVRALKGIKRSPLALDLYAWASYAAYQTQRTGRSRSLSWELLHEQFGSEYRKTDEFARKAWKALVKIQAVYPELKIERVRGGLKILPSKPSITIKLKKTTSNSR